MKKLGVVLSLLMGLSACGGGGGSAPSSGNSGNNGTPPTSGGTTATALSFSPALVSSNYQAGSSVSFTVVATPNNPSDFNGATTIYTLIVDNTGVITKDFTINRAGDSYFATMHTSPSIPEGKYRGNFSVLLCRDSACQSQFPGSPSSLPFEITVTAAAIAPLNANAQTSSSATMHLGGTAPSSININVTGKNLVWSASTGASWLQLSNASGTGNGSFSASFQTANLAAGTYSDTVVVTSKDGQKVSVPVTLTILSSAFTLSSNTATFSAINGTPLATQSVSLQLDSNATTTWSAASDASWLSVSPSSGTTPGTLNLTADPSRGPLGSGSYSANVNLSAKDIPNKSLPVRLTLTPASLTPLPSSLSFGGTSGREFLSQPLKLSLNTLSNAWPWTISGLPAWLTASTLSGTVNQAGTTLNLTPNPLAANAGSNSATIYATARVNGDTLSIPINATLNIDTHKLVASETGLSFTSTPAWSRLSKTIQLTDNLGAAGAWAASSDQAWLTVTASGTTTGGVSSMNISANPASLPGETVSYATVTVSSKNPGIKTLEKIKVAVWKSAATPAGITKLNVGYSKLSQDPIRPYVYAHNGGASIDVYHIHTAQKIATIGNVGAALGGMAASRNGDRLYVLDTATRSISVIDLALQQKVTSWPITNASTPGTTMLSIRPNGKEVLLLSDGSAYAADNGKSLGYSGIFGISAASSDGKNVFSQDMGLSPATVSSYAVDYSDMSGGVLMVKALRSTSFINGASNGKDIAVSADSTHLYAASGAPYRCSSVNPGDLSFIGSLPGGDAYPNNVKVGSDGRVYCGIFGWYSTYDVWMHNADGSLRTGYKFAGYAQALLDRQLVVSADGLMLMALTSDPRLVFVAVGP